MEVIFIVLFMLAIGWSTGVKVTFTSPYPTKIIPNNYDSNKTDLIIHNVVNYGGYIVPAGPVMTEGIRIAINAIERKQLLPDYNVIADIFDDECDHSLGVGYVTKTLQRVTTNKSHSVAPVIVGPICGENEYTGRIVKFFNFVQVSQLSVSTMAYVQRQMFANFFVVLPSFEIFYEAIPALMESQGWSEVYLLTETYPFWGPLEDVLLTHLERRNMSLVGTSKIVTPPGQIPGERFFEMIAQEVEKSGSRIFVFNTDFALYQACWFHRYHLYGPGYVYILPAFGIYLPTLSYYKWCSRQMLFDVMKSFIVHNNAFNMDWYPDEEDDLGTTGRYFDQELKSRIENPHHHAASWYFFRATTYDQLSATATALALVDEKLKMSNDTWKNWLSGTDNFLKNGSYITDLLRTSVATMEFNGLLSSTKTNGITARKGDVGFSQFHYSSDNVSDLDGIKLKHFALYKKEKLTIVKKNLKWRTKDGKPPFDRMRLFNVYEVEIGLEVDIPILCISVIILIRTIFKVVGNYKQMARFQDLSLFNIFCRLGIICLVIEVITETFPLQLTNEIICKLRNMLSLVGLGIILTAVSGKLYLCVLISVASLTIRNSSRKPPGKRSTNRPHSNFGNLSIPKKSSIIIQNEMTEGQFKKSISAFLISNLFQIFMLLIWTIALDSVRSTNYFRRSEFAEDEQSTAYRYYTVTCSCSLVTPANIIVAVVIGAWYFLVGIVAIRAAVSIPTGVSILSAPDIQRFKQLAYIMMLLMIGGFSVIWVMSSSGDLVKTNVAITFIEVVICIVATAMIDLGI